MGDEPIPETYERGNGQNLADLVLPITLLVICMDIFVFHFSNKLQKLFSVD